MVAQSTHPCFEEDKARLRAYDSGTSQYVNEHPLRMQTLTQDRVHDTILMWT